MITNTTSFFCPPGSPSRGGDVAVYVYDMNQPNLPSPFLIFFLLILFLCLFLYLRPFQLYFITHILPTTLRCLTLFFLAYFSLTGLFNYTYL